MRSWSVGISTDVSALDTRKGVFRHWNDGMSTPSFKNSGLVERRIKRALPWAP